MPPKRKASAMTTAASSKATKKAAPAAKKARASSGGAGEAGSWSWAIDNDLLVWTPSTKPSGSAKVIAFDFDSTLCQPKDGKPFPKGVSDIEWFHSSVPTVMQKKVEEGYALVVMSNQGGLLKKGGSGLTVEQWQERVGWFLERVGLPIYFYAACGKPSNTRKPNIGMWDYYATHHNDDIAIDKEASYYIGDAAGRVKGWAPGRKKDFSAGDRMYAHNIGVNFQTPEEFFLGQPESTKWEWGGVDPQSVVAASAGLKLTEDGKEDFTSDKQEMILMMGYPASGKSTFVRRKLSSYERINMDTLKTKQKCWAAAEAALAAGKSVVIDNTNPTADARAEYIKRAKKAGVPVRLFWMQTSQEVATHNNQYRGLYDGDTISSIAFRMYKGKMQEPKKSEGLTEIKKINFKPEFDNDAHKDLFLRWSHA